MATPTLADAAAIVVAAETAALQAMQAKATAFRADMQAILDGLTVPPGFNCPARQIAQQMVNMIDMNGGNQIAALHAQYNPPIMAAAVTGTMIPAGSITGDPAKA